MILIIEGKKILSSKDFHQTIANCPIVPDFYGKNLDALWDTLTGLIGRPFSIKWTHSEISKQHMGPDFDKIVKVLEDTKQFDLNLPVIQDADKFTYKLD